MWKLTWTSRECMSRQHCHPMIYSLPLKRPAESVLTLESVSHQLQHVHVTVTDSEV